MPMSYQMYRNDAELIHCYFCLIKKYCLLLMTFS